MWQLDRLDSIDQPGSKAYPVLFEQRPDEIFIVRKNDIVRAYVNRCPHTRGPLDWMPDQFLDVENKYIQCATHDARFQISDGLCVQGPCVGEHLIAIELVVQDQCIYIHDARVMQREQSG